MIKPVTMYSVVCDRCGKTFEADGNIAWTDPPSARFYALESEWIEIGCKHYCPECYEYNDKLDKYVPKKKQVNQVITAKGVLRMFGFLVLLTFSIWPIYVGSQISFSLGCCILLIGVATILASCLIDD